MGSRLTNQDKAHLLEIKQKNIFQAKKCDTFVWSLETSRHLSAAPRDVLAILILPPFRPDMAMLNPCPEQIHIMHLRWKYDIQ